MNTLTIETDTAANAKKLVIVLKSIGYVKSVRFEKPRVPEKPLKSLTESDWVRPGRPATVDEHEKLCREMEKEKGGYTTEELRKELKTWIKKRSK